MTSVFLRGFRIPLPHQRETETVSFEFNGQKFHVSVSFYPDGKPGEVFVVTSLVGSPLRETFEAWARLVSKSLQRGVSLRDAISSITGTRERKGKIQCEGQPFDGVEALSAWDALARVLSAWA